MDIQLELWSCGDCLECESRCPTFSKGECGPGGGIIFPCSIEQARELIAGWGGGAHRLTQDGVVISYDPGL